MRDVKEFVDFEAKFEKKLIFGMEDFLFHVVVLVRVEFQLFNRTNALIHLNIKIDTLKR